MARGLAGENGYEKYVDNFQFLSSLVKSERIVIYYSGFHFIESLAHGDVKSELMQAHCNVVDTLTKGDCVVSLKRRLNREIEIFLSDLYRVDCIDSQALYPYGKYIDAVDFDINDVSWLDEIKRLCFTLAKSYARIISKSRKKRREKERYYSKEKNVVEHLRSYPKIMSNKADAVKNDDPVAYNIVTDMQEVLNDDEFVRLIFGKSEEERTKILRKIFCHAFQFSRLINVYGSIVPSLKGKGEISLAVFQQIEHGIRQLKELQKEEDFEYSKKLTISVIRDKLLDTLMNEVEQRCTKYDFNMTLARRALRESKMKQIPTFHITSLIYSEYFNKHWDTAKGNKIHKGRNKPKESDVTDLNHAMSIPYVNIYLSDGFFSELLRKVAKDSYGTIVFRNLMELQFFLEKNV